MVKIKPLDAVVKKYIDVTPGRAPYYEAGVKTAGDEWFNRASSAGGAWSSGVQEAVTDNRYVKGIKKAGPDKYVRKASTLGVRRYSEGVRAAEADYRQGFAPYHDTISRLVLPDRGPRGDPKNYERVRKIGDALHKKRLELLGAGGT